MGKGSSSNSLSSSVPGKEAAGLEVAVARAPPHRRRCSGGADAGVGLLPRRIRAYGGERDVDGLRHDSPPLPQKPKIHRLRATSAGGSHRQDSSRRWAWWPRLKRQLHHPERDDVEEVVVAVVPRFPHLTRPCSSLRQGFFLVAGSHCGWHHGLGRCRRDFRVPTPRGVVLVAVAAAGPLLEAENERELSGGEM